MDQDTLIYIYYSLNFWWFSSGMGESRVNVNLDHSSHIPCIVGKGSRGWQNMEKRPTLTFIFSWIWLTPNSLPNIVCFPSSNVFFECFFVIQVYFFLIHVPASSVYLTSNLQDPRHTRKCSVHKSLLGGTYVGNYWKWQVLWISWLPPILLPGLVRIWSRYIIE